MIRVQLDTACGIFLCALSLFAWAGCSASREAKPPAPLTLEEGEGGAREERADAVKKGTFERVVLEENVALPMELTVVPDGRVFFLERGGPVKMWNPETDSTRMVGFMPVSTRLEFGLLGLTHDPNFQENGWLYVYYTPPEEGPQHLSRFTFREGEIDPESEVVLLEVPVQREECCHTGGSLAFGPDGNLFLSTGDNTNPFASSGFAPIDERPGREPWDAQRSSGNTNSLSGKILRIRPQPDGTYTIPEGNLFQEGDEGRPEIYVMGNRNPYRISVDQETGWLYWGEVGPDAGAPKEDRGPAGHDEINQAREAGNYGWPYFVGNNKAYHDYNFATETSGAAFDPAAPVNESPNNTGARVLPPAQKPLIWYPYGPSEEFPAVGTGGRTAMAGPVYYRDEETAGPHALPAYYDGSLFIYEWARNWIKEVKLDEEGNVLEIRPFLPKMDFIRPMDMEVGPEGALYVVQYGTTWEYNEDAEIIRLDYHSTPERAPRAAARVEPASGPFPLEVDFYGGRSTSRSSEPLNYSWTYPSRRDRDEQLDYAWDFDGDGVIDSRQKNPSYTYNKPGSYTAHLTVTDAKGMSATQEISVSAGNTMPDVELTWPVEGGIFDFGEPIPYQVEVSDPEEATIAASQVVVQPYLVRDAHRLPQERRRGEEGTFQIHQGTRLPYTSQDDLYALLNASYTDSGAAGVDPLSGRNRVILQPRRKEAEHARIMEGVGLESEEGVTSLQVEDGSYASYAPLNLKNIDALTLRVKPEAGGTIEARVGDLQGALLASAHVDSTSLQARATTEVAGTPPGETLPDGGWRTVRLPVDDPGGTQALYLVFRGEGDKPLMKLDWIEFKGKGMMAGPPSDK